MGKSYKYGLVAKCIKCMFMLQNVKKIYIEYIFYHK